MSDDSDAAMKAVLEDMGHRTESIMRKVYGSWDPDDSHAWSRFTLYDKIAPGRAGPDSARATPIYLAYPDTLGPIVVRAFLQAPDEHQA